MRFVILVLAIMFSINVQAQEMSDFRGFNRLKNPISLTSLNLKLTAPLGGQVDFKSWQGRWLLMNTWATWCAPCVVELPTLFTLAQKNPFPNKLAIIAVSFDANRTQQGVIEFLKKRKIGVFAAFMDSGHALEEMLEIDSLPVTYLINPNGEIVADYRGGADWSDPKVLQALTYFVNTGTTSNKSAMSP